MQKVVKFITLFVFIVFIYVVITNIFTYEIAYITKNFKSNINDKILANELYSVIDMYMDAIMFEKEYILNEYSKNDIDSNKINQYNEKNNLENCDIKINDISMSANGVYFCNIIIYNKIDEYTYDLDNALNYTLAIKLTDDKFIVLNQNIL